MASLTGEQLKDSYQSLVTIGDSIVPNPTSGQLENGLGNPITALGIGTASPDVELQVASDRNGKIRIESTVSALNANDLAGAFEVYKNDASTNGVGVFGSLNVYSQDLGGSSYLTLNTSGSDGNNQARLRIDSSGTIQVRNQTPTIQLYNTDTSLSNEQTLGDLDWYQNDPSGSGVNVVAKIRGVNESSFQGQGALAFHVGASGSASEKVRIDSLGNVGIGATSITAVGSRKTLHINDSSGSAIRLSESSTDIAFLSYDSTSFFRLSSSDQIALMTAGSEAMRIDSSGNVGIGGIADSSYRLHLYNTNNSEMAFEATATGGGFFRVGTGSTASGFGGALRIYDVNASAERMRIDSSGNVLVGTTATPATLTGTSTESGIGFDGTSGFGVFVRNGSVPLYANRRGTDGDIISLRKDGTTVGSISVTGSSTSYNTSSDHRLKENVVPMEGALDKVAQLKPSRFNFIADTDRTVDGFLAHEVAEIVPNAVSGEKDAVDEEGNPMYQGIDHSKLVPILVGAIQELKAEIEQLKAQ